LERRSYYWDGLFIANLFGGVSNGSRRVDLLAEGISSICTWYSTLTLQDDLSLFRYLPLFVPSIVFCSVMVSMIVVRSVCRAVPRAGVMVQVNVLRTY